MKLTFSRDKEHFLPSLQSFELKMSLPGAAAAGERGGEIVALMPHVLWQPNGGS